MSVIAQQDRRAVSYPARLFFWALAPLIVWGVAFTPMSAAQAGTADVAQSSKTQPLYLLTAPQRARRLQRLQENRRRSQRRNLAVATFGLGAPFSSHMVLQRNAKVPIWGWAKVKSQKIEVTFNGQHKTTSADNDGWWRVELDPMPAGGPYDLKVNGQVLATDVLVGDVWLCAGQSNMDFGLDMVDGLRKHAPEVVGQANHPEIRLWMATGQLAATPARTYLLENVLWAPAHWMVCTPDNVISVGWNGFSAVGYFFGRALRKDLNVPIGLMEVSEGGSTVETWISPKGIAALQKANVPLDVPPLQADSPALKQMPEVKDDPGSRQTLAYAQQRAKAFVPSLITSASLRDDFKKQQRARSICFNGEVAPIIPFAVKGMLWYQGAANSRDHHYQPKLEMLIHDWREQFHQSDLPVLIVQLSNWCSESSTAQATQRWQLIREAQLHVSQTIPHTGLVVTIDLADKGKRGKYQIHPRHKQPVGERLALAAEALVYHQNITYSGPTFKRMSVRGNKAILEFDHVGGGLVAHGDALQGFTIADKDQRFVPAQAAIHGDTVVVSSPKVAHPVAVRYAFDSYVNPLGNFYNRAGLPASPFRTDNWPVK